MWGTRNAYKVLVRKPEWKRRCEAIITDLKKIGQMCLG
jgi:hypothetical protein